MNQRIRRILAFGLMMIILCPLLTAAAENPAQDAPQETAAPTEKPKVSAADLQAQGILSYGAKGDDVKKLQQRLKELGYLNGKVDGQFGGGTKRAVIAFQRRNGLDADGEAGQTTQAKLYSADAIPAPTEVKIDVLAGDIPMLVNKDHTVDEFFQPDDLVQVKDILGTKLAKIKYKGTKGVRTAVEALKAMLEAATADGLKKWQVAAGYRTWDEQVKILNNKVASYRKSHKDWNSSKARRAALRTVAEPGASEHHLGLAFDINVKGASSFVSTKQSKWLSEHCWEYGFIIRYQEEKKEITGFEAEPWHIRYVGVEHAMYMKEHNLCLEEYVQGLEDGTIVLNGQAEGENEPAGDGEEEEPAEDEAPEEPAGDEQEEDAGEEDGAA